MHQAKWRRYLRFWRPNIDADVDDELRFHFGERIETLIAAGLTRDEARRQAECDFGDVEAVRRGLREIDRRVAGIRRRADRWEQWRQDFAYSARSLRRLPGLSTTIVLTLALGLGLNGTLFSLLDRVFLRMPDGVVGPEQVRRLYWLGKSVNNSSVAIGQFSIPIAAAVSEALGTLARTTVYRNDMRRLGDESEPSTVVASAGPGYFSVLGVHPAFGRFFSPEEDRLDVGLPVAIVSDAFWRRRFGDSPADALGQTIVLDKRRFTIVGVAPREFRGVDLDAADIWVPLGTVGTFGTFGSGRPWYQEKNLYGFELLARSSPNMRSARLEAASTVGVRRAFVGDRWRSSTTIRSGPLISARGPEEQRQEVSIALRLGGVALIVLLIACANVANLLLAHSVRRRREIGLRAALGITRAGIARLFLAESLILALVAGVMAFLVATWSSILLRRLLFPWIHWTASVFDWRVAVFTLIVTLLAGVGAGLVPALRATRTDVAQTLKSGIREGGGKRSRIRAGLVIAQAALSTVLLVGALLFVKSLRAIHTLDLGFDVQRLIFVSPRYEGGPQNSRDDERASKVPELASRLAKVPGVESVAMSSTLPMYQIDFTTLYYASGDSLPPWTDGLPSVTGVSPGFFTTVGLRLLRGRGLTQSDVEAGDVAIVNQTLARNAWPHDDPLGKCLRLEKPTGRCVTIVGVVEDARRVQLIEKPVRQMYLVMAKAGDRAPASVIVRVPPSRSAAVANAARREVPALLPGTEANIERMADLLAPQYRPWELGARLFSIFGLLALVVAAIGVFSSLSHEIGQRRHELGVRVALGAGVADVVRLVIGGGIRLVLAGVMLGTVLALAAGRLIASLLYGVAPRDPATLAMVTLLLVLVATVASLGPAWRASRTDPMEALHAE